MSNTKKSFEDRAAAAPTALHKEFAQWIYEQTGVRVDEKAVQLVTTLRHDFQRSETNQKSLAQRKADAAAKRKKAAADKKARLEAQLAKLKGELDKVETEEPAAVQPAVQTAAKKTTAPRTRKTSPKALDNAPETDAPAPKRAPRTRRTTAAKAATPATK